MQQTIAMPTAPTTPATIELRCVWPDYQPIKVPVEVDMAVTSVIEEAKPHLIEFGITRILLINDVIYPFNNIARDVLKFDPAEIKKLDEERKLALYELVNGMAAQLLLDPLTPSQAVLWNNDVYVLMSTRATILKTMKMA